MGQLGQHCLKRPLHIDQHLRLKQRLLPDLPDQFQVGFEPLLTDSLVYLALSQVGPGTFSLGTRHTQLWLGLNQSLLLVSAQLPLLLKNRIYRILFFHALCPSRLDLSISRSQLFLFLCQLVKRHSVLFFLFSELSLQIAYFILKIALNIIFPFLALWCPLYLWIFLNRGHFRLELRIVFLKSIYLTLLVMNLSLEPLFAFLQTRHFFWK